MSSNIISFDEFEKMEMRIGTILNVEGLPRTQKLYKINVDLGSHGRKQTIASLAPYYTIEQLKGKKVVFLANLKPTKFSGEISEGMLLAAEDNGNVSLLSPDKDICNGALIR